MKWSEPIYFENEKKYFVFKRIIVKFRSNEYYVKIFIAFEQNTFYMKPFGGGLKGLAFITEKKKFLSALKFEKQKAIWNKFCLLHHNLEQWFKLQISHHQNKTKHVGPLMDVSIKGQLLLAQHFSFMQILNKFFTPEIMKNFAAFKGLKIISQMKIYTTTPPPPPSKQDYFIFLLFIQIIHTIRSKSEYISVPTSFEVQWI